MTVVLARPAPVAAAPAKRPSRLLTALPWTLVAVVYLAALAHWDVPPADIARYSLYLVLGVVAPGTLVHRALRGSRGNLPEDLGLGLATGLFVQLVGWASAAATGLQQVLWCWPLLVLAVFAAVPSLRRHWRIADHEPLPARWSWLIAWGLLVVVAWGAVAWSTTPLPPADTTYYQDLMYHLALVQEMTRSMPFEVPQLAGDTLRYHYLSDADMAAASMITRIPETTVLLRLWSVPVGAAGLMVIAALARDVSGRWWAGPLAGAVAIGGQPLMLGAPVGPNGGSALSFASPSQTYAVPLLGLLTLFALTVLRNKPLGPAWFVTPVLALAVAGSKSSALPPLIAGVGLAGLVRWWRDRAFPRATAGLLVALVIPMLAGAKLFAGGGAGVLGVQALSILGWMDPYHQTLGQDDGVAMTGLVPLGVEHASAKAWVYLVGLIGWWLLMQAPRLLGLAGIGSRKLRQDPAAWLLGGMIGAGTGAAWLLYHPSASQVYFFTGALPFGCVLTVWLLADRTRRWWVPVAGLLAGVAWTLVAPQLARPRNPGSWGQWATALGLPVLWTAGLVAVGAIVVLLLRKTPRSVVAAVVAATLGGSLAAVASSYATSLWHAATGPPPAPGPTSRLITQEEMRGAMWLDEHTPTNDVVATNVHCQAIATPKPCDARAFWVTGLGGRRTLIEAWGYSDQATAANGVNGLKYMLQPPPDPAKFALNQRAFRTADPTDLRTLHDTYGVRWLLADVRASPVAPELAERTAVRFTSGPVTIYELGN
ncbi:hypothetical protein [Actinoplanes sp. N902-109]|uniref:hypothetical protein n=1 Tax=Actinoplanes sp. (strain N902-109) TaxID=649831 RepID=UPI000329476D|nr:hypothetical protein [Actinoplanes sp. N902-109]AGL14135.1 hypothetical protein L083_0625 [Actinoplanes sp. N902-109]